MTQKPLPKPNWIKNTYFWIAGVLFLLAVVGVVAGEDMIRDPGQRHEGWLSALYLLASGIMFANGVMSHRQTVQHYEESVQGTTEE